MFGKQMLYVHGDKRDNQPTLTTLKKVIDWIGSALYFIQVSWVMPTSVKDALGA